MTIHGAQGIDVLGRDYTDASMRLDDQLKSLSGFVVDCNHGGGNCGAPADLKEAGWQFMKDHPFGMAPEPYAAGLPATFPSYCSIY